MRAIIFTPAFIERFWAKVEKSEGCWNWTASTSHGYGVMNHCLEGKSTTVKAHIVSYILVNGELPVMPGYHGAVVRHTCDNRKCVNPDHLLVGTQLDNIRDTFNRRRTTIGERNPMSKLTNEKVREIRKRISAGEKGCLVAEDLGISQGTVSMVASGKRWGRVS